MAERGVGGEKANAQSQLDRRLKLHGLTTEDLDCEFPRRAVQDKDVLEMAICYVRQQHKAGHTLKDSRTQDSNQITSNSAT